MAWAFLRLPSRPAFEMPVSDRRRLLIISRDCPPLIGPHAIRVAKLVKFLPEFGWEPTVVTAPVDHAWAIDLSLEADLADTEVIRVPRLFSRVAPPTSRIPNAPGNDAPAQGVTRRSTSGLRHRAASWLLVPDSSVLWAIPAARHVSKLARTYDAILTTAPPFSTHIAGYVVSGRTGIPWLAEYRDNWTMNPLFRRGPIPQRINEWIEHRVVAHADAIVAISEAAAGEIESCFPAARGRVVVAQNGFDADDLPLRTSLAREFEFAYAGSLNSTRDPRPFFRAVLVAGQRRAGLLDDFRLRLIGNVQDWAGDDAVATFGPGHVSLDGMLSHKEALRRAAGAAVLLLITTREEAGGATLTSKVFEYLALGRPILALTPPGPARSLVDDLEAGYLSDPTNVEEIANAIVHLYDDWIAGRSRTVDASALEAHTRRTTAERVSEALELAVRGRTHQAGHGRKEKAT